LDGIFEQIDAGEVEPTGHVGCERGDAEASLFANSRNGTSPMTVSSEVGEVELAVPGTATAASPRSWFPKGRAASAAWMR
jgi:putative transposase